jgi:hypothetical protein
MLSVKGIQCSLVLGPERCKAREILQEPTPPTQNTATMAIEAKAGEFALEIRLENIQTWTDMKWFNA